MKAIRIHEYGNENVLKYEDAPIPEIKDEEVLIKVHSASVNPVDWKVREGYLKEMMNHELPLVLGWDVSGVIETIGKKVTNFQIGDQVYSRPDIGRNGSYAEYIAVKSEEVSLKPKSLDHNHAAAIPLAALTAWQGLFDIAKLSKGQRVLIHAAAGGVGIFAVQLAKSVGAHVIGTASAAKHDFLRELGVDETIDYTKVKFEDEVKDVDVVFDTIGGETQERSWQVLKKGGHLVSITDTPSEEITKKYEVKGNFLFVQPNASQLEKIAALVAEGKVKAIIEKVYPLENASEAQKLSQTGRAKGKIILQVIK